MACAPLPPHRAICYRAFLDHRGVSYAYDRESFRNIDLPELYKQMNREDFQGALPQSQIMWSKLDDAYGEAGVGDDGSAVILLDPRLIRTREQLRSNMLHEMCHLKTTAEYHAGEDAHGAAFQNCMAQHPK
jgi:predicted SprT family Zn-dependent metalloprotease